MLFKKKKKKGSVAVKNILNLIFNMLKVVKYSIKLSSNSIVFLRKNFDYCWTMS